MWSWYVSDTAKPMTLEGLDSILWICCRLGFPRSEVWSGKFSFRNPAKMQTWHLARTKNVSVHAINITACWRWGQLGPFCWLSQGQPWWSSIIGTVCLQLLSTLLTFHGHNWKNMEHLPKPLLCSRTCLVWGMPGLWERRWVWEWVLAVDILVKEGYGGFRWHEFMLPMDPLLIFSCLFYICWKAWLTLVCRGSPRRLQEPFECEAMSLCQAGHAWAAPHVKVWEQLLLGHFHRGAALQCLRCVDTATNLLHLSFVCLCPSLNLFLFPVIQSLVVLSFLVAPFFPCAMPMLNSLPFTPRKAIMGWHLLQSCYSVCEFYSFLSFSYILFNLIVSCLKQGQLPCVHTMPHSMCLWPR